MTIELTHENFLYLVTELSKIDTLIYSELSIVEGDYHKLSEEVKHYIDKSLGINRIIVTKFMMTLKVY